MLRWHIAAGQHRVPQVGDPVAASRENIDVFDFELADDDMATIAELDDGTRTGPDPDRFG